jgi:hypothetical protein
MGAGQPLGKVQPAARQRATVGQADERLLEQHLLADLGRQLGKHTQRQVGLAIDQLPEHRLAAALGHHQVDARRLLAQQPQQRRQHHPRAVVRHRQAEGAARPARLEAGAAEQAIELLQRLLQRLAQGFGTGAQLQPAAPADQQQVSENLAQLGQRVAYRRLAAVQAQSRPRDMSFAEQGMQGEQQVEVDAAQIIHGTNTAFAEFEFPSFKCISQTDTSVSHRSSHHAQQPFAALPLLIALLAGAAVPFRQAATPPLGACWGIRCGRRGCRCWSAC